MAKRPVPLYDFAAFGQAIKAARTGRNESRKKVSDEIPAAYRFKDKGNDFVQAVFVYLPVAYKMVVLDIVLNDFLINAVCVCRFLSFPFRRRSRFPAVRQGV